LTRRSLTSGYPLSSEVAHRRGHHAQARATVWQFETLAPQADIIGQWEPAPANAIDGPLAGGVQRWTAA
jgi:hypothetical protein